MNNEQICKFYQQLWPVSTGYQLIRIGGNADGGYLVPDALSGIQYCLSPGTCGYIEFERQLGEVYGIPSLLCDPGENAPKDLPDFMRFDRVALAGATGDGSIKLADWTKKYRLEDASPYLMTMDIEGGEVDVINSLNDDELFKIRIATIEFHYIHLLHMSEASEYAKGLCTAFEKMCRFFDVVHMKPNNHCPFDLQLANGSTMRAYTCIEVTFLSKMMRRHSPRRLSYRELPNALDKLNNIDKPPVDYSFYALASQQNKASISK